jgi:hypothetical protein
MRLIVALIILVVVGISCIHDKPIVRDVGIDFTDITTDTLGQK